MTQLADFAQDAILLLERQTLRVLASNARFKEWQPELADTCDFCAFLPSKVAEDLKQSLATNSEKWSIEFEMKPAKGRKIPVKLLVEQRVSESGVGLLVATLMDRTELTKSQLLAKKVGELLDINARRIKEAQKNFKAMLDRLPQGFLVFGPNGVIGADHSVNVHAVFGDEVAGRKISELLPLSQDDLDLIKNAFGSTEGDLFLELLPKEFHVNDRIIETAFSTLIEDDAVAWIMLAALDVTVVRKLREELEESQRVAQTIYTILQSKVEFLNAIRSTKTLDQWIMDPPEFRRRVHTLKGTFSVLNCMEIASVCDHWERQWMEQTYSPELGQLCILALVKETKAFLDKYHNILRIDQEQSSPILTIAIDRLQALYQSVYKIPQTTSGRQDVLDLIESIVSPELHKTIGWLQKAWSDALVSLGKPPSEICWDARVRLFPENYNALLSALVHIVRNAADHGIEDPEVRRAASKSAAGLLSISAEIRDGSYYITITDDGRGIDPQMILATAKRKGVPISANLTRDEILRLIFHPGFSSKDEATTLSGHGIGLNAVEHALREIGGEISLESEIGIGTRFYLRFPKIPFLGYTLDSNA